MPAGPRRRLGPETDRIDEGLLKKKQNDAQGKENDGLTPKQVLVMWKLVLLGDGQLLSRFTPKLTKPEEEGLVGAGLCTVELGKNRSRKIRLTEKGWSWANGGFTAKVGRTSAAAPVLDALLARVGAYLEVHELALDDLLRPRRAALAPGAGAESSSIEERIRAAYLRATGGKYNEYVRLARLRAELGADPASAVDAALLGMQQKGGTVLYPTNNPQALGPEDEAAALRIAGARRDVVCIER
jgi:hypothetical protein